MRRALLVLVASTAALLGASPAANAAAIDGYLAFDDFNTGQIYSVTQLGTNLTQLTHVPAGEVAVGPRWSRDATRIVFVIGSFGVNGPDRMYTMHADGSHVHRIWRDSRAWNNGSPDWFPNGRRIAFARCGFRVEACELASINVDGTGFRILTGPSEGIFDFYPSVSPDGTRIAFTRFNAGGIHAQVWVMNADGTAGRPITAPRLEAGFARWSPDGTDLIVSSNCCRLGGDLYRVPADGGQATRLTTTSYPNSSGVGSYAPSGREIAFISDRGHPDKCCTDLYLMRADGAHQAKVGLDGLTGPFAVDWGRSPAG